MLSEEKISKIYAFCTFVAAKSGGPGGQHVNKTSTAVTLYFDFMNCPVIDDYTKRNLHKLSANRINSRYMLIVRSEFSRSQFQNKQDAFRKLIDLIISAEKRTKRRIKITPSKSDNIKRVDSKKKHGEIKSLRKKIKF